MAGTPTPTPHGSCRPLGPGPGLGLGLGHGLHQTAAAGRGRTFSRWPAWGDAGGSCWDGGRGGRGAQLHRKPSRAPSRAVWVGAGTTPPAASAPACAFESVPERELSSFPGGGPNRGPRPPPLPSQLEAACRTLSSAAAPPTGPPPEPRPRSWPPDPSLPALPRTRKVLSLLWHLCSIPHPPDPSQHSDEPSPTRPHPRPVLGTHPRPEVRAQEWNLPREEEPTSSSPASTPARPPRPRVPWAPIPRRVASTRCMYVLYLRPHCT